MRYVAVEFRGGPRDGEKMLFEFPPAEVWEFAAPRAFVNMDAPHAELPPERAYIYRLGSTQDGYEVVTLLDQQLRDCLKNPKLLAYVMNRKRPMLFDYEGVRE
jgi:hypothetical protein